MGSGQARTYGLNLRVAEAEPAAVGAGAGPDVLLRTVAADAFDAARAVAGSPERWFVWTRLEDGADFLQYRDLFEFLISPDGRTIEGCRLGSVHPETYEVYLLNQALSFAALKLGLEPIHATVVQVEASSVALCGPPGAGKTTLAASLLAFGGRLVTDDLLIVRWEGDRPFAQAGPARIKLMPDTAEHLLPELASGIPMNPNTLKRIVPLPAASSSDLEVPLGLIALLRPHRPGRVVVRTCSARAAMLGLVANTFNPIVTTEERSRVQFGQDARLAGAVACVSVTGPKRWDALEEVAGRLRQRLGAVG